MTPDEVVALYSRRYRYGFLADWELARDLRELESLRDDAWYRAGWYEILGYDRQGRSYITYDETDSELDELLEDEMVKEEQKYGY